MPAQSFQNPWTFLSAESSRSSPEGDGAPDSLLKQSEPLSAAEAPGHPARHSLLVDAIRRQAVPRLQLPRLEGCRTPFQVGISGVATPPGSRLMTGIAPVRSVCPRVCGNLRAAFCRLDTLQAVLRKPKAWLVRKPDAQSKELVSKLSGAPCHMQRGRRPRKTGRPPAWGPASMLQPAL